MKGVLVVLIKALLVAGFITVQAQTVSTFAGSGTRGGVDGAGTSASFYFPQNIAVDGSGNVYVADTYNHKIRKISPAGVVTTLAGSGSSGSVDGTGTSASFNSPMGVAVDGDGNVYVADHINNKIRKISPAGVVTTFAGSGSPGDDNGTGTAASFRTPAGVAVDGDGNVYVADYGNFKIRKISPAGVVSTFAGLGLSGSNDGVGAAARFRNPMGIAVDVNGNVYVADAFNQMIRKITPAREVSTLAGSTTFGNADGIGAQAGFATPQGIAVDGSGNVYVADTYNYKIRKINSAGAVTTLIGNGSMGSTDGTGAAASFNAPTSVAIDANGNIYVADNGNHKIRKIIGGVLPVGLTSFTAKTMGSYTQLQWQTISEVNNKGFEIYRKVESGETKAESEKDIAFVKIGEVLALAPHNTQPVTYNFTDKNPLHGINYYKLVQVDNDGATKTYGPIAIKNNLQLQHLTVYATNKDITAKLTIENAGLTSFTIYNLNGEKLFSKEIMLNEGINQVLLEKQLSYGVYIMKVSGATINTSAKFVQHE